MKTIILHSQDLAVAKLVAQHIDADIQQKRTHFRFSTQKNIDLNTLRERFKLDFNLIPENFLTDKVALFVSDMDSTLINIECIDEIADFANLKPQVAAITEKAMRGELDFDSSLSERVALLKGLEVATLEKVYTQKLQVNPGGQELINFLSGRNIKSAVVSGGFTYFTDRLAADIGLDYSRANTLAESNGCLTGVTQGAVINANAKADFIHELCELNSISTKQVIAIGDGANDLEMMKVAGLSVAYHAKPIVAQQADIAINVGGLDKIIDLFDT
ncbi:MAG: phosphoserine phosphatase SerB [Candidatus Thioglobus sp.]|uniref:phosphoserine phosphatase SerB n=1 Tax=Candidatus Thioglobus sp. TaxID=2026721 RepID=UPI0026385B25|nr:phosphoserine phosphatase SerB [Candidatus Thioglobus sp.]MDC9727133.1 phosphoserine phosphatase SerB [Candidatus Thioglobus sp.]